jgi:peptide subunit release factor RF-3
MTDINVSKLLRAIEVAYQMEDGELDSFVNDSQDIINPYEDVEEARLKLDSAIGNFGVKHILFTIAKSLPNPAEKELLLSFINTTTDFLSEEDLGALFNIVVESLVTL